VAWVGDVRVLRFRDGTLTDLTRPHSLENDLLARGVPPADVEKAALSGVIVRALGMSDKVEVELVSDDAREKDVYVLVSDAAYVAVGESLLASTIAANCSDARVCTRAVIEQASANGARDMVSVLTIVLGKGDAATASPDSRWETQPRFVSTWTHSHEIDDAPPAEHEPAIRSWRTAATACTAWRRFRSWLVRTNSGFGYCDAPVEPLGAQAHHQWVGPAARALVLFEKHQIMTGFLPDGRGSDRASRWRVAIGTVPFAPRALDVDLFRAEVRVLGGVPIGFIGDLDPHGLHVFGALRSGDLDAPDIHGRRLRVEWLGIDDAWLRSARETARPLRPREIRMGWCEREYWAIVKRFAPDVQDLIGEESFAMLESGIKLEAEAFDDVIGECVRRGLRRLVSSRG
jgi:hypothetical protein